MTDTERGVQPAAVDRDDLRQQVQAKYTDVVLDQAGFKDVRWGMEVDVFSGSQHESDAAEFETRGVTFAAIKPTDV